MGRASTGTKRRELLMIWIRKCVKYGGLPVNRKWCWNTKDPDIQKLFKKGLIKQVRQLRSPGNQRVDRLRRAPCMLTRLMPVDGKSYDGVVTCPDCGWDVENVKYGTRFHAVDCALRTDHENDPGSPKQRAQMRLRNKFISRSRNGKNINKR